MHIEEIMDAQLARHDERLKNMDAQITKLDQKIDNLSNDIQEIKMLVAHTKGAWWAILAMSTMGGAVASFAFKFLPFLR